MIVDAILDRKAYPSYTQEDMDYILNEAKTMDFDYITSAFETGSNKEIQAALCKYIDEQDYNPEIKEYINKNIWTSDGFTS